MSETTLNAARISQFKAISALILLAWSLPAHALTLGKFQVQSVRGEPLRAEVEVTQFTPDELRGLQVQLASPSSFRQVGMEYNPVLNGLMTHVENRSDGKPVIVLNGRSPVQDAFIDLILEAQWATGRAVKNYVLLLNSASPSSGNRASAPPAALQAPSDTISSPISLAPLSPNTGRVVRDGGLIPSSSEVNAKQVPVYRHDNASTSPVDASAPLAVNTTSAPTYKSSQPEKSPSHSETLTVRPGDTASHLVMGLLPANVSLDQMLLAMARANPSAFIEGNVNLIRAGSILRIPKPAEATQISREEARQTVIAQNRDFAAYARRLAESPLPVGAAQSREMSGSVTTDASSPATSNAKQDKLTLSKAQTGDNSAEAKLAAEREAKDAADQLSALNKNMQDLEALAQSGQSGTADATTTSTLPTAVNNMDSLMDQLRQNRSIWAWIVGGVLTLLTLVLWSRKNTQKTHEVFAPSYDDGPSQAMAANPAMAIPPQMADIDLNLNTSPTAQAPTTHATNDVTEQNKLELASQLLASGDKDLAQTLIMSVASTASGELRSRAQQMLGQIA